MSHDTMFLASKHFDFFLSKYFNLFSLISLKKIQFFFVFSQNVPIFYFLTKKFNLFFLGKCFKKKISLQIF